MYPDLLQKALTSHQSLMQQLLSALGSSFEEALGQMVAGLQRGGKILVFGNGGSAADAQHFAAELVGRFQAERRALPAIALTTDTSALTAIGNDYGFDRVFSRQVEALAQPGDVLLGISTSGNSGNVLRAFQTSVASQCVRIALTGQGGGAIATAADVTLAVPSADTPRIQEAHILLIHTLCEGIEQAVVESANESL